MKILVTGADGQLGQELLLQGRKSEFEPVATDLSELDITAAADVDKAIARFRPFLVINAAAYTQVDRAESEPLPAGRVNAEGPAVLAGACRSAGIAIIHISTDYVFDGEKNTPYTESDPVAPTGVYARSKADGENRIRSLLPEHIILRTSWLYGVFGHNFVKTMLRIGRERKVINVVNDQFGSPTSATDLARTVLKIASDIHRKSAVPWGTYHYCGKGVASWHEFAEKIFSLTAPYQLFKRPVVQAISTDQYPTPAKRPRYSALDCSRIHQNFGISTQPWPESLAAVIKRIMNADKNG
ncbi:MAG: dTDP-4-dehydrorhamnose reductase [Desulfobacterales bacterium]|nr:dTDP-4-dehydrorhamnose reductase [Desulfobacterales bacterium]